jgi:hypothetical protein
MAKNTCASCEQIIGNLEESFIYQDRVICKACKILLDNKSQAAKTDDDTSSKISTENITSQETINTNTEVSLAENQIVDKLTQQKEQKYNGKIGKYLCPDCKAMVVVSSKPKRSFMGFLRIQCPTCKKEFSYPLTPGYVACYWFLLAYNAINTIYLINVLLQGGAFIPNPIGMVVLVYVIISLVKNTKLKREIDELRKTLPVN